MCIFVTSFAVLFRQIVKLCRQLLVLVSVSGLSLRSHGAGDHGAHAVDAPGPDSGQVVGGGDGVRGGDLGREDLIKH